MARRGLAVALLVVALPAVLAGCFGVPCGPGEAPIDDVQANATERVSIGGTITEFTASRIVLEDGTGRALLVSLEGYDTSVASTGDCVEASGDVVEHSAGTEYDLVVRTTTVTVDGD